MGGGVRGWCEEGRACPALWGGVRGGGVSGAPGPGGLGGPSGRSFEPNTRVVHFFGGSVRASLACVLNGTNKKSQKNNGHHEIAGRQ